MADTSVRWTGLDTLMDDLRKLPEDLALEAGPIVERWAQDAARTVAARYPTGPTGNLKKGVRVTLREQSRYGTRAFVKSSAKHSWIFEHGTKRRSYSGTDRLGRTYKNADRGTMKPAPLSQAAIPVFASSRRRMYDELAALVARSGATLTYG